ncbi:MAG: hypothetical protein JXR53_04280 [Bacteroidales bacterium]|nr:hypothetical protein [Bacteroidales bacterium]
MFLFIFGTGKLQAQNNLNMLPDSGNVGIGTSAPNEKFEVNGNAKMHGKVKMTDSLNVEGSVKVQKNLEVTDSMTVGTKLTVENNVEVKDSLSVGNNVDISKNLYVADTLTVGTMLKVNQISDVQTITTQKIIVNTISGNNTGIIDFGDDGNSDPECSNLRLNYCTRNISGFLLLPDGSQIAKGVAIGISSMANGEHSFAAGQNTLAAGDASLAFGYGVRSFGAKSITIGTSSGVYNNTKENCLMIAFNADIAMKPSFFVGPSNAGLFGNVGIGTDAPSDKLQIGDGIESITFGSALNDDAHWLVGYMGMNASRTRTDMYQTSTWTINSSGASGGGIIATDAGGKMYIIPLRDCSSNPYTLTDADIIERHVVEIEARNESGDCSTLGDGIMKVHGKIWCKEVEVVIDPSFWWDEVFEPDYKLRSFEELQTYIEENGHLPDVPSEQEVTENGLPMGESYGILLRKIEELTLYMLDLKKENEELRQMIENNGE